MQMRSFLKLAAIAAAILPMWAHAHDLRVNVSTTRAAALASQDVEVNVRYANAGKQPIYLGKWYVSGAQIQDDMFEVTRDGRPVEYLGAHYKRRAPLAEDLVALAPGKSITRRVRIGDMYDMSQSGNYMIRFRADADHVMHGSSFAGRSADAARLEQDVVSNDVSLWVEGRRSPMLELEAQSRLSLLASTASLSYASNCTTTQKSTISTAFNSAKTYANSVVSYLGGTPRATTRFTTWFGTYSTTNWGTIKTQFTNIKGALDTKPVVVDCSCKDAGTFAYVYPSQPYKIYVCGAFWKAGNTGTDSRAGTLIHELSHFTVIAGTQDYAYGQTAAKNLAKTDAAKARKNADSHEYFAENTPALP